jgi:hypothetical protein
MRKSVVILTTTLLCLTGLAYSDDTNPSYFYIGSGVYHEYASQGFLPSYSAPGSSISVTEQPSEITGFDLGFHMDRDLNFTYAQSGLFDLFPVASSAVGVAEGKPLRIVGASYGYDGELYTNKVYVDYKDFPGATAIIDGAPRSFHAFDITGGIAFRVTSDTFGFEFGLPVHYYKIPTYLVVSTPGGPVPLGPYLSTHTAAGFHVGRPAHRGVHQFYGSYNYGYSIMMGSLEDTIVDPASQFYIGKGAYDLENEFNLGYEIGAAFDFGLVKVSARVSVQEYFTYTAFEGDVVAMKDKDAYNAWQSSGGEDWTRTFKLYDAKYSTNKMFMTKVTMELNARF